MAKHKVVFVEACEVVIDIGALTVKDLGTGKETEIDPGRREKITRKVGEVCTFRVKREALAFIKSYPPGSCKLDE